MKRVIAIAALSIVFLGVGSFIGWWANSPGFDLLCAPASVYELKKDIEGEGFLIKSGTKINLRSCEYANRFSVEFYYEKGVHPDLFMPINSAANIGNHGAQQYRAEVSEQVAHNKSSMDAPVKGRVDKRGRRD